MCSGKSGHLGSVLCRAYENSLGNHKAINGHDGANSDLLSMNSIQTFPNSYVFMVVLSLAQAISAQCHLETAEIVSVTLWPSTAVMVQLVIFFLWVIIRHSRTFMSSGKSGHLGIVLCQACEYCLGDHMAIKDHDGPISGLMSLNYIQIFPNSYLFGSSDLWHSPSRRNFTSSLWIFSW